MLFFYDFEVDNINMDINNLFFFENIKELAKKNNITIESMIQSIDGLSFDTISTYNSMRRIGNLPRADDVLRIADFFGVSVEYLVTGNEVQRIDGFDKIPSNGNNDIALIEMFRVEAAAGKGLEIAEYYDVTQIPVLERFIYPYKAHEVKAVVVKGDSMEGVQICHNDIVLFVPEEREGNGIYVISINNKVLVKRIEFNPAEHCVRVLSENEKYAPIVIKENGSDVLTVNGRVIVVLHRAV